MRRLTASLSILVFGATIWIWARSYRVYDQVIYAFWQPLSKTCTMYALTSNGGRCRAGWETTDALAADGFGHGQGPRFQWTGDTTFWNRIGFGWGSAENELVQGRSLSYESLTVPYWALAIATAVVPVGQMARARRRRRQLAMIASAESAKPRSRPSTWRKNRILRQVVTPSTVMAFALISGLFVVCGILNIVGMILRLSPPSIAGAIMPVVFIFVTKAFWRLRRRLKRSAAELCAACGYDLTGNVSGICSECGSAAEAQIGAVGGGGERGWG